MRGCRAAVFRELFAPRAVGPDRLPKAVFLVSTRRSSAFSDMGNGSEDSPLFVGKGARSPFDSPVVHRILTMNGRFGAVFPEPEPFSATAGRMGIVSPVSRRRGGDAGPGSVRSGPSPPVSPGSSIAVSHGVRGGIRSGRRYEFFRYAGTGRREP